MSDINPKNRPDSMPSISVSPESEDVDFGWAENSEASPSEPPPPSANDCATLAPPMPQNEYQALIKLQLPTPPPCPAARAFVAEAKTARLAKLPPDAQLSSEGPEGPAQPLVTAKAAKDVPAPRGPLPPPEPARAHVALAGKPVAGSSQTPSHASGAALPLSLDLTESLAPKEAGAALDFVNSVHGPPSTRRMGPMELEDARRCTLVSSEVPGQPLQRAQTGPSEAKPAPEALAPVPPNGPAAEVPRAPSAGDDGGTRVDLPAALRRPTADVPTTQPCVAHGEVTTTLPRPPVVVQIAKPNSSADNLPSLSAIGEQESPSSVDPDVALPIPKWSARPEDGASPSRSITPRPSAPPRRRTQPPTLSFGVADGSALELVAVRASSSIPPEYTVDLQQVRDRFAVGDFSGTLALAEALLERDPENTDGMLLAEHCRDVLRQMSLSRLGGLTCQPKLSMTAEQLRWLSLDHRAGFVLSLVDGSSTVDEILDMSGMPDWDVLRILCDLLDQNVIRMS